MIAFTLFMVWLVSGCSLAAARYHDAEVNAALMDMLDQYQHRADLVSILIAAVHGEAGREQPALAALVALVAARSQLATIPVAAGVLGDPVAFERFEVGQRQLEDSLSGLLIAIDVDRRLAADPKIRRLKVRFANAESRVNVSRGQYDKAAKQYNTALGHFPNDLMAPVFGYRKRPTFSGSEEVVSRHPPRVDFDSLRGSLRV